MKRKLSQPENKAYRVISSAASKKSELLEALRGYTVSEHGPDEEDYDYLGEDGVILEVENSEGESLFIELSDSFTLYFDSWHNSYGLQEYEFQYLLEDMNDLLKNRKCVLILSSDGKWAGSALSDGAITAEDDKDVILHGVFASAVSDKPTGQGSVLRAVYRDSRKNITFEFTAE